MFTLVIESREMFDDSKNEFIKTKKQVLQLEHSLVSLSKWESKWQKPFLSKEDKTSEELLDYIRCMTITQNVDPNVYRAITNSNIQSISKYISSPMTATTFSNNIKTNNRREIVTSELIYYWMVSYNIPMECQKWHLNRLLTLIRVCSIKNTPPKNMSKSEIMNRNRALNAARRKKYNSRG